MEALRQAGRDYVAVVVAGIVPDSDEERLRAAGVARVFHPGSGRDEIVAEVARLVGEARAKRDET